MNTSKKGTPQKAIFPYGVPGGIRTPDLLVRSQTLYPAELRAHILSFFDSRSYVNTRILKMQQVFSIYFSFFENRFKSSTLISPAPLSSFNFSLNFIKSSKPAGLFPGFLKSAAGWYVPIK